MRKISGALLLSVVLLLPVQSFALEARSVIKGSFRDLYPDAILVAKDVASNASFTGLPVSSLPAAFQDEFKRTALEAVSYSKQYCEGKSNYAIADNFELHSAFDKSGALLFTNIYNVICFDLPPATAPKAAKKEPITPSPAAAKQPKKKMAPGKLF